MATARNVRRRTTTENNAAGNNATGPSIPAPAPQQPYRHSKFEAYFTMTMVTVAYMVGLPCFVSYITGKDLYPVVMNDTDLNKYNMYFFIFSLAIILFIFRVPELKNFLKRKIPGFESMLLALVALCHVAVFLYFAMDTMRFIAFHMHQFLECMMMKDRTGLPKDANAGSEDYFKRTFQCYRTKINKV